MGSTLHPVAGSGSHRFLLAREASPPPAAACGAITEIVRRNPAEARRGFSLFSGYMACYNTHRGDQNRSMRRVSASSQLGKR